MLEQNSTPSQHIGPYNGRIFSLFVYSILYRRTTLPISFLGFQVYTSIHSTSTDEKPVLKMCAPVLVKCDGGPDGQGTKHIYVLNAPPYERLPCLEPDPNGKCFDDGNDFDDDKYPNYKLPKIAPCTGKGREFLFCMSRGPI